MKTIDNSELRSTSKLPKYIPDNAEYYTSDILERVTGADTMISPTGLPKPSTETLIKFHIKSGAKLVQLKFGHDLIASILDGRYKESQSRMKLIGANPWQSILLFIGIAHSGENNLLMINNQLVYGIKYPPDYKWYRKQVEFWNDRGGVFSNELSPRDIWTCFDAIEENLTIYKELPQKKCWPTSPILHDEELEHFDNSDYLTRMWRETQKLVPITDLRILYERLPGIGKTRATDIWNEYKDIDTFLVALKNSDLGAIKGVGKGTIQKVIKFLYGEKK